MDLNSQPILKYTETNNSSEKMQQIVDATDSLDVSESTDKQEIQKSEEMLIEIPSTSEEPLVDAGGDSEAMKTSAGLQKAEKSLEAEETEKATEEENTETEEESNSEKAAEASYQVPESPRFVLKSWSVVASWSYDLNTDICHICRNKIMDLCIKCMAKEVLCLYYYIFIVAFDTLFTINK